MNEMTSVFDIRALRQLSGRKQKDLANAVGLSVHELMKLERGLANLDDATKHKILRVLQRDLPNLENTTALFRARECGEGYVTARPTGTTTRARRNTPTPNRKYVLDLFCGVGGFSAGFEHTEEFEVVAGVDLLGDRLDTFVSNHSAANAYGQDIRTIETDILDDENPRPFVIVGGPPCQGFSSIRPFRNIEWADPRNNLAEEFCRIVDDLRPEWIVFENVVGLLTHEGGKSVQIIRDAFEAIGYRTDVRVLNTASYGIPQRRERLIIVGSLKKKAFKWPAPTNQNDARSMVGDPNLFVTGPYKTYRDLPPAVTLDDALHDLPALQSGQKSTVYRTDIKQTPYEKFIRNGAKVLSLHEATSHSPKMLEIIRHSGANISALPAGMVTSGFSSCYSRLDGAEPSVTITVNFVHPASNRCIHPHQDRALTPREGARIQGFFDTFRFDGSRAQIVKQIGNAVPPMLGRKIAEAILESD
jgi:DNA (cytosine-5)-methyltransferase 1